jgi:hypothetical protein
MALTLILPWKRGEIGARSRSFLNTTIERKDLDTRVYYELHLPSRSKSARQYSPVQ